MQLSARQLALWQAHKRHEQKHAAYTISQAFIADTPLNAEKLAHALDNITRHHTIFQTTFSEKNGRPIRKKRKNNAYSLNHFHTHTLSDTLKQIAQSRIDLTCDPLLQVTLINCHQQHILLIKTHHIVCDGWSFNIIMKDLIKAYHHKAITGSTPATPSTDKLVPPPTPTGLPFFHPTPSSKRFLGKQCHTSLVKAPICKNPAAFFSAAFALLLHRYTGETCITMGTNVYNRCRHNAHSIDYLVATQPLSITLACEQPFTAIADMARRAFIKAARAPKTEPTHWPIVFNFQRFKQCRFRFDNSDYSWLPFDEGITRFPLCLEVWQMESHFYIALTYRDDLFNDREIEQLMSHYLQLIEHFSQSPTQPLLTPPLDTNIKPLHPHNHYPQTNHVVDLFLQQAVSSPKQIAVIEGQQRLSYQALNEHSTALALQLKQYSADAIGIVGQPNIQTTIAMLAIFKAGKILVPLSDECSDEVIENYCQQFNIQLLAVGKEDRMLKPWDDASEPWDNNIASNSIAYLIFTSGTTGHPKPCKITHQQLAHYCQWMGSFSHINAQDRMDCSSPMGVDFTFSTWLAPLCHGATICFTTLATKRDPQAYWQHLKKHGITMLKLTPSYCQQLLATLPNKPTHYSPRTLILGGEQCTASLLHTWFSHFPNTQVHNQYGPTETAIAVTCRSICATDHFITGNIGTPAAHADVGLVDKNNQPTAPGMISEIIINGYHSGDLAYWSIDGDIIYLGRRDRRVKFHGHRIQLEGIEKCITSHPAVLSAYCFIHHTLIAAVTLKKPASTSALSSWINHLLPPGTCPIQWVITPTIPLTSVGKVDEEALAKLSHQSSKKRVARPIATGALATAWTECLHRETCYLDDHFFELGADSFTAMQLAYTLSSRYHCTISTALIFKNPVFKNMQSALNQVVQQKTVHPLHSPLEKIIRATIEQERLWQSQMRHPTQAHLTEHRAITLQGQLSLTRLNHAIQSCITHHAALRTKFTLEKSGLMQTVTSAQHPTITPTQTHPEQINTLCHRDATALFDLTQAPLMQVKLYQLSPTHHVLSVALHHIISDATSIALLCEHLSLTYNSNEPLPITTPLTTQAHWQGLHKKMIRHEASYWQNNILTHIKAPPALLHAKHSGPHGQLPLLIQRNCLARLQSQAKQLGSSAFTLALYRTAQALTDFFHTDDLILHTPLSTRLHGDFSTTVGCFMQQMPIRLTSSTTLTELEQQLSTGYSHQLGLLDETTITPMQILFVFDDQHLTPTVHFKGLIATPLPPSRQVSQCPLAIILFMKHDPPMAMIEYDGQYFSHMDLKPLQAFINHANNPLLRDALKNICTQQPNYPAIVATKKTWAYQTLFSDVTSPLHFSLKMIQANNHDTSPTAYTIKTSGTTGVPKSIRLTKAALFNTITAVIKRLNIPVRQRHCRFANNSFDAAYFEIYLSLLTGGTLYQVTETEQHDPNALFYFLDEHCIEVATLTPAILQRLPKQPLPHLHTLVVAGDVCDVNTLNYWAAQSRVFNAYGPTEATICATIHRYQMGDDPRNIGKPIDNMQACIIDEQLALKGIGISPSVTLHNGYYLTGDAASTNQAGDFIFEGRIDHQVKWHGIRLNLTAIELTLKTYPSIVDAIVIERDNQILAFITVSSPVNIAILQSSLQKNPEIQSPHHFIQLDIMPLTMNGKIDRKALQQYPLSLTLLTPHNDIEKKLLHCWQQSNAHPLDTSSSFFDCGGDSLSAATLIAYINTAFGTAHKPPWIFQYHSFISQTHQLEHTKNKIKQ